MKRFIQISWRGIRIGNECFQWVYSLQSQRNHACVPSSFESQAIEAVIRRRSVCLKQERCVVVLLCVVGFVMTQFAVVFVNVDCFRIMEHEK